jgi:hypothetical protein
MTTPEMTPWRAIALYANQFLPDPDAGLKPIAELIQSGDSNEQLRIAVARGEDDRDGSAAAIWAFRSAKDGDPIATWERAKTLAEDLNAALDPKVHA